MFAVFCFISLTYNLCVLNCSVYFISLLKLFNVTNAFMKPPSILTYLSLLIYLISFSVTKHILGKYIFKRFTEKLYVVGIREISGRPAA